MADVSQKESLIEVRREARRKRILENAENRLKIIAGSETEISIKPVEEKHIQEPIAVENYLASSHPCIFSNNLNEEVIENIVPKKTEVKVLNNDTSITSKFEHFNTLLVVVAILTRILINSGIYYYLNKHVFMPFILLEILAIIIYKRDSQNRLLNAILILSNLNKTFVQYVSFVIRVSEMVLKDFSIYFFIFLISHVCLEVI